MSLHLSVRQWMVCGLTAFAVAGGCSDPSAPAADAGPPFIELGTGERAFEPLSNGDPVEIVFGPQGGYHVWGTVRAGNVRGGDPNNLQDPSNPTTTFEVRVDGERVDAFASSYTQGLKTSENGFEMVGRTVILDTRNGSEFHDREMNITVRIEDVDGLVVSDERTVVGRFFDQ